MIAPPALAGFPLEADASRRSPPFAASAQLAGAALLPTLAGETLATYGLDLLLLVFTGPIMASLLMVGLALAIARRAARS